MVWYINTYMTHPLTGILKDLSDDDLAEKINMIVGKLSIAARFYSSDLVLQMQMVLDDYYLEQQNRSTKNLQDLDRKMRERAGLPAMEDIIDIGK